MKLVDEVVPREKLVETAKAMIAGGLKATKPWDQKGWKPEGAARVFSPAGFQLWPAANALYRKETYDNYPGARYLLQSVFEGLQLPMDAALQVESRYFAHVLQTKEAAAMIRSLFVSMQELNKGARRPKGEPQRADQEARRPRRGLHGRRHRLRLGAGRHRRRAPRPRHGRRPRRARRIPTS